EIKTVGETLIVNEWIPIRLFQFFEVKNVAVNVLAQDPGINLVCASQLRNVGEGLECLQELAVAGQRSSACLRSVIGELAIEAVISQFGRVFRMHLEQVLDVILGDLLKGCILLPASVADQNRHRDGDKNRNDTCCHVRSRQLRYISGWAAN